MKIGTWILAAIAALGMSAPAKAFDWTGFYTAVLYESSTLKFSDDQVYFNIGKSGFAVAGGYNFDQGDWIFGIDKMIVYTPILDIDCLGDTFDFDPFFTCDDEVIHAHKIAAQILGRVGYEITDNAMIYAGAGGGWLTVYFSDDSGSDHESFAYGALAAGLEVAMSEHWYARIHAQGSFAADFDEAWVLSVAAGVGFLM